MKKFVHLSLYNLRLTVAPASREDNKFVTSQQRAVKNIEKKKKVWYNGIKVRGLITAEIKNTRQHAENMRFTCRGREKI